MKLPKHTLFYVGMMVIAFSLLEARRISTKPRSALFQNTALTLLRKTTKFSTSILRPVFNRRTRRR